MCCFESRPRAGRACMFAILSGKPNRGIGFQLKFESQYEPINISPAGGRSSTWRTFNVPVCRIASFGAFLLKKNKGDCLR